MNFDADELVRRKLRCSAIYTNKRSVVWRRAVIEGKHRTWPTCPSHRTNLPSCEKSIIADDLKLDIKSKQFLTIYIVALLLARDGECLPIYQDDLLHWCLSFQFCPWRNQIISFPKKEPQNTSFPSYVCVPLFWTQVCQDCKRILLKANLCNYNWTDWLIYYSLCLM